MSERQQDVILACDHAILTKMSLKESTQNEVKEMCSQGLFRLKEMLIRSFQDGWGASTTIRAARKMSSVHACTIRSVI